MYAHEGLVERNYASTYKLAVDNTMSSVEQRYFTMRLLFRSH
jgi:hypothetical protein